jgi:hypothetical protein
MIATLSNAGTRIKPIEMPAQLQFRFKAEESFEDIDPQRIEAALRGLDQIERFKIFDDRLSDATFVTLVIVLRTAGMKELLALQTALTSIPNVRAFAVASSGAVTPLDGLPPDRLREVAASDVKL